MESRQHRLLHIEEKQNQKQQLNCGSYHSKTISYIEANICFFFLADFGIWLQWLSPIEPREHHWSSDKVLPEAWVLLLSQGIWYGWSQISLRVRFTCSPPNTSWISIQTSLCLHAWSFFMVKQKLSEIDSHYKSRGSLLLTINWMQYYLRYLTVGPRGSQCSFILFALKQGY